MMDQWQRELDNDAIEQEDRVDTLYERKAVAAIERKQGYIVADTIGDSWPESDFDARVPLSPAEQAQKDWTNGPDGPCMFELGCKRWKLRKLTKAEIADIAQIMGTSLAEAQSRDMANVPSFEPRAHLDRNLDYDTSYLDTPIEADDIANERPAVHESSDK